MARSVVINAAMIVVIALATIAEVSRAALAPDGAAAAPIIPLAASIADIGTRTLADRLPNGKGMWIWQRDATEGGDVGAIVAKAVANDLSHVYVRTGSSWDGFYGGPFLDEILPAAHAAGIRVYAWDFPRLIDNGADVARAAAAISHEAPGGHRIDGFAADIETGSEGVNIGPEPAAAYGAGVRQAAGPDVPLIAVVPNPVWALGHYPYTEVIASFDAVAPMVYWMSFDPGDHTRFAMEALSVFGKPIYPVGQAYDAGPEGGPRGVPPKEDIWGFMATARDEGSPGVSFWAWQHADEQAWEAIRIADHFPR